MAITSAISDLFKSFYELLASVFGTAYAIVHSVFAAVFGFITGIFKLAGDVLGGFVDITTGVGKFIVGMYHWLMANDIGTIERLANIVSHKATSLSSSLEQLAPLSTSDTPPKVDSWRTRRPTKGASYYIMITIHDDEDKRIRRKGVGR